MTVPDPAFFDPRLAATYDVVEGDRDDLDHHERLVDQLGRAAVLDVGCGTGELACRLARRGFVVTGADPAMASVDIARAKRGADAETWIVGNVAQVFLTDDEWDATLSATATALRPGGTLVFESRDPARRPWEQWIPEVTRTTRDLHDGDRAETWCTLTAVDLPLVSFRGTTVFESDGATIESDSTLRFRSRAELGASLDRAGFDEVRDAADRPGLEWVYGAQRR